MRNSCYTVLTFLLLSAKPMWAQADLSKIVAGVEKRYNSPKTMELLFEHTVTGPGRMGTRESGTLYLSKPGRMQWVYQKPAGKFFLSDSKFVYFYNPGTKTVEKSKFKESDDMRVPLAFLMGRLDFKRDFRQIEHRIEGSNSYLIATLKSDNASFKQVEFRVTPAFEITYLKIAGLDQSVNEFQLSGQKINPGLDKKLFQFSLPAGAQLVEATETQ